MTDKERINDLKDDIIDSFVNQNIISDWTLKDGVLEKYNNNEEFDNDDEREYLITNR